MDDQIALSVAVGDFGDIAPDELPADVVSEIKSAMGTVGFDDARLEFHSGSTGYNADAFTVIAVVLGILELPESLRTDYELIRKYGGRIARALGLLKTSHVDVCVSFGAALSIAVDTVATTFSGTGRINLLSSSVIPVRNESLEPTLATDFASQPDRFYVFTFQDTTGDAYVVAMRSSGALEFAHRLPAGDWLEYLGAG